MTESERNEQHAKEEVLARLRRVEGQVRGLQRMIEERRGCEDIITQLTAARAALDKVALLVLKQHLRECLRNPDLREQNLEKAMELLFRLKS